MQWTYCSNMKLSYSTDEYSADAQPARFFSTNSVIRVKLGELTKKCSMITAKLGGKMSQLLFLKT